MSLKLQTILSQLCDILHKTVFHKDEVTVNQHLMGVARLVYNTFNFNSSGVIHEFAVGYFVLLVIFCLTDQAGYG